MITTKIECVPLGLLVIVEYRLPALYQHQCNNLSVYSLIKTFIKEEKEKKVCMSVRILPRFSSSLSVDTVLLIH